LLGLINKTIRFYSIVDASGYPARVQKLHVWVTIGCWHLRTKSKQPPHSKKPAKKKIWPGSNYKDYLILC